MAKEVSVGLEEVVGYCAQLEGLSLGQVACDENKADYVLALKGNQESLHDAVIESIDQQIETNFANVTARTHTTHDKEHGLEETRISVQLPAPQHLPGRHLWKGLRTIGVVISICLRNGKETVETRYYISSLAFGLQLLTELGHCPEQAVRHDHSAQTIGPGAANHRQSQLPFRLIADVLGNSSSPATIWILCPGFRKVEPGIQADDIPLGGELERHRHLATPDLPGVPVY